MSLTSPYSLCLRNALVICLPMLLLLLHGKPAGAGRAQQARALLLPGQELTHRLPDGQTNEYEIELAAGQAVRVMVRELDVLGDLQLAAYSPEGPPEEKLLVRAACESTALRQEMFFVAARGGRHRLTIEKKSPVQTAGRYAIRIAELRPSTPADDERLALQEALREVRELRLQKTPATQRQAIARLREIQQKFAAVLDAETRLDLFHNIGLAHAVLDELAESGAAHEESLRLAESLGDRFRQATILYFLSERHRVANRIPQALAGYEHALRLARESGNFRIESFVANNSGAFLKELGEYSQAVVRLERALELFRELHPPSMVTPLNNLGLLYKASGEGGKALDQFQQLLEVSRRFRLFRQEATALLESAALYYWLGDAPVAQDYYRRALALAETLNNRQLRAVALTGLGASAAALGEHDRARAFYEQALPVQREVKDRGNEGITLGALGLLAEAQGDRPQARRLLQEGLALVRGAFDRRFEIAGLVKLGAVEEALGDAESARGRFAEALALSEQFHDQLGEAEARFGLARLAAAADVAAARAQMETALRLIETQRRHIAGHSLRAAYFASVRRYHEFYVDLLMRQAVAADRDKLTRLALEAGERARARGLLDLLGETRVDLRAEVAPELLARERELQQALNAAGDYQQQLLSRLTPKSQTQSAQQRIDRLTIELREAQARIRAASTRYAALTAPPPVTAEDIQRDLLDADTALLEYHLGERRSYLWVATRESLTGHELPPRAEIERRALRVLSLLTARQPAKGESDLARAKRIAEADRDFSIEAAELSRLLLPAAGLDKPRLAVVADGALQYLPFAMLPNPGTEGRSDNGIEGKGAGAIVRAKTELSVAPSLRRSVPPLIANYEVINLPSASALATLRREFKDRAAAPKTLAIFADPVFETDDPRLARNRKSPMSVSPRATRGEQPPTFQIESPLLRASRDVGETAPGFSRLLYSRREANRILSFVPEAGGRLAALDFNANRAAVFDPRLAQFRLLHFATHGVLNEVHPELSGIVLSLLDETGKPQEGFLRLHEIYTLKLNADLVTLSACQTGLGKQIRGEGLVGLTRGFMFAGTPRVLASLWKVRDDATAELMMEFYRALLRDGQRPAQALRTAQLAMMKKANWQSPFYWAAFVLQGEWR